MKTFVAKGKSYYMSRFLNLWRDHALVNQSSSRVHEFLQPHIEKLYRQAYMYTYDSEKAEDLLQDLTLKLYDNLDQLDAIKFPLAWLRRCLYNLFIDRHRREKFMHYSENITEISDSIEDHKMMTRSSTPEERHQLDSTDYRIRESIMSLSPTQKAVATLFFFEHLSMQEISDQLGIAIGTVKSRLHRARNHLMTELEDLMPSQTDSTDS